MEIISSIKCHGGQQKLFKHQSRTTQTQMECAVFLPPNYDENKPIPALIFLSGLTCNWENVMIKAGAQRYAAEHGIAFIAPDTSPRGSDINGREVANDEAYDLGQGAGFYLNATEKPWAPHFSMQDYIVDELPEILAENFSIDIDRLGLTGHSMGGHGALTLGLTHPTIFKSLSAFSPISAPRLVPWGQKAFQAYLGNNQEDWAKHDACTLIEDLGYENDILVDVGDADPFLNDQLKPELLQAACSKANIPLQLNLRKGYDHSYYFIASFIEDHIKFHSQRL